MKYRKAEGQRFAKSPSSATIHSLVKNYSIGSIRAKLDSIESSDAKLTTVSSVLQQTDKP